MCQNHEFEKGPFSSMKLASRAVLLPCVGSLLVAHLTGCGASSGSATPADLTGGSGGGTARGGSDAGGDSSTGGTSSAGGASNSGGSAASSSAGGAGGTASSTVGTRVTGTPTANVVVTSATTYQTLEGFGAAVAWYQSSLTSHAKKAEIYDLAFAQMGLDILRFRNTYQHGTGSSVTAEKEILDRATTSLGRRPKVLLTSWSPPAALKANGKEDCASETTCTLKKVNGQFMYAEFATYWSDAIEAYRTAGIAPDFVSIQNEPDFIPGSWEGCKFEPAETSAFPGYGKALTEVHTKLAQLTDPPKIIGPETLGVHYNRVPNYMAALDATKIQAVAHHLYEMGNDGVWDWRDPGPDSYVTPMKTASTASKGLPIFQTEFQTDADEGIDGGFETAWLIHDSLVDEGVSAWLYWDLVWDKSGLIALNGTNYTVRDQYYSMRHYARFTDPGYVRVDASSTKANVRVSAFRSPDGNRLTLVVLNVGASEEKLGFEYGSFGATSVEVYRTTYRPGNSETWVAQPSVLDGGLLVLPSRSVATIALAK
jgi:glucuronoarabinoxylan endo-1,4-beta-xylanase